MGIRESFVDLFEHRLNDEQMREFLLSLKLDTSLEASTLATAANVMRSYATHLPIDSSLSNRAIDIVGTGGDKIGSFNISSTVALLCAASGSIVAKHGSRSITSKSGSADMFEKLGIRLDLSLESSAKLLQESNFTFMFVQNHHPAMKFIMPIRRSIPDKTIFNILGPLTNPANVTKMLLGVFNKDFTSKMAKALMENGASRALVVSSGEHMDEISLSSITYGCELKDATLREFEIDPTAFGIKKAPLEAIVGGDGEFNAKILYNIFTSQATDAQRDIVLINSAFALMVDGIARDVKEGLEIAKESIASKKALLKLKQIIEISNKL